MTRHERIVELLSVRPMMSEAIARELNCPEASVRRNVQELRKRGYRITAMEYPTGWEFRLD